MNWKETDNIDNSSPVKSENFHQLITENGATLLHVTVHQNQVKINHIALMIYNLCDGKRKTSDIIQILKNEFPNHQHEIRYHVSATIKKLRQLGTLQVISQKVSQAIQKAVSAETEFWRLRGGWDQSKLLKKAEKHRCIVASFDNGQVNIDWYRNGKSRCARLKPYLQDIATVAPDISGAFAICTSDLVNGNQEFPLLGFSSHVDDKTAVLIPDIQFINGHKKLRRYIKDGSARITWHDKNNKLVWRGSPTGQMNNDNNWERNFRVKLCIYAANNPDILDARIISNAQTSNSAYKSMQNAGLVGKYITEKEQLRYKYVANIDGNSASWGGTFWQLLSNSLMIHIDDNIPVGSKNNTNLPTGYRQWYHHWWKPGQHFLRCRLDELENTITWAKEHDDQCREITDRATAFANEYLSRETGKIYFTELLRALSKVNHNQEV